MKRIKIFGLIMASLLVGACATVTASPLLDVVYDTVTFNALENETCEPGKVFYDSDSDALIFCDSDGQTIVKGLAFDDPLSVSGDTVTFDSTQLSTATWGDGSPFTWTFDSSADDPTLTFGNDAIALDGNLEFTGDDTTPQTTGETIRGSEAFGELAFDARGSIIVNIDTNNNDTSADFRVRANATATDILELNQAGVLTVQNLVGLGYDCTTFTNGGALTANASGVISCSDDDGGGGSTFVEREITFFIGGDVNTGIKPINYTLRRNVTYKDMACSVDTAASGSAVEVDIEENGTDIFGAANRVSIAAASSSDISGAPSDTTGTSGDVLTLEITAADSGDAANHLTCQLRIRHETDGSL